MQGRKLPLSSSGTNNSPATSTDSIQRRFLTLKDLQVRTDHLLKVDKPISVKIHQHVGKL